MPYKFSYWADGQTKRDEPKFSCHLECKECRQPTKTGAPCRRRVCIGLPYCWFHLAQAWKVKVGKSKVRNAGRGLFAHEVGKNRGDLVFPEGTRIMPYDGESLSRAQKNLRYGPDSNTAPYGMAFDNVKFVDSACRRHVGALANTWFPGSSWASSRETQPKRLNADFVSNTSRRPRGGGRRVKVIYMYAIRDIHQGEEILADYGAEYGESKHATR